ncbi:amidase [Tunicatimonas pelagia]|uniref:amidase n=1 Tax=Tunicatimonas pelagia TaxID=931531 RepID=UPI002666D741|nr:amidase [Tunicatimonas pelagia]WKN41160.1 amidase [Tunicatimonas pelagia]
MKYLFIVITTAVITALVCFLWFKAVSGKISDNDVQAAQKLLSLDLTDQEIDTLLADVQGNAENYALMHQYTLKNEVPPALLFDPVPHNFTIDTASFSPEWNIPEDVALPINQDELAFYSVLELASLLKNQKITSTELTQLYLDRIHRYDDTLLSVITVTEELALEQARRADEEIQQGKYRGPLHGIPYGVKDLLAVEGYKTTWGANSHKNQTIDQTATVVKKLEAAGAVLIAKLTSGALARGDVWFGGTTKSPWDLTQGASGSSAGSASAVVAGLVGFAIGTETMGSISSPSTRCGASGLRPTFGRVSRHGVMTLSWSLDKAGPICRSAEDAALVFDAIRGADPKDRTTVEASFDYDGKVDVSALSIGIVEKYFEDDTTNQEHNEQTLEVLRKLGANFQPVSLPDSTTLPVKVLSLIMFAEAGAAFDDLTRSNLDDSLVRQDERSRPNALRQSRFIPAVEYIQANRYRYQLIQAMDSLMQQYDVIVTPTRGGNQLLITNMTGHPVVVVPNGFDEDGHPQSITFIGNLYDEASILEVAHAYQQATEFEDQHPDFFLPKAVAEN